jgi:hypothetical protein
VIVGIQGTIGLPESRINGHLNTFWLLIHAQVCCGAAAHRHPHLGIAATPPKEKEYNEALNGGHLS